MLSIKLKANQIQLTRGFGSAKLIADVTPYAFDCCGVELPVKGTLIKLFT